MRHQPETSWVLRLDLSFGAQRKCYRCFSAFLIRVVPISYKAVVSPFVLVDTLNANLPGMHPTEFGTGDFRSSHSAKSMRKNVLQFFFTPANMFYQSDITAAESSQPQCSAAFLFLILFHLHLLPSLADSGNLKFSLYIHRHCNLTLSLTSTFQIFCLAYALACSWIGVVLSILSRAKNYMPSLALWFGKTDPSSLRMQTDPKKKQSEQQASPSIIKLFNATETAPGANTMRSKIC